MVAVSFEIKVDGAKKETKESEAVSECKIY